jgi:hypothetical protein
MSAELPFGDNLGNGTATERSHRSPSTSQASVRPVAPPASPEKAGNDSKARARIGVRCWSSLSGPGGRARAGGRPVTGAVEQVERPITCAALITG